MYKVIFVEDFLKNPLDYIFPISQIWLAKNGKKKRSYVELYCGFDIETYTEPIQRYGYMYIWQFSIFGKENFVIYGRIWSDFVLLINTLKKILCLDKNKRLIIAIANLSFEFQFLKRWFTWTQIFAREIRNPIYAIIDDCIELRDVLMITGGSLKTLAKQYTKTQKMDGSDLDYKKIRTYKTKIGSVDFDNIAFQYCINDVIILSEFMQYIFDTYIKTEHFIPMTKTGLLRREVKKEMGKNYKIKQEIYRCFPETFDFYTDLMKYCFRGGYCHSNILHTGKIIDGIQSKDITSSYPYTLLTYDGFPNSPLRRERPELFNELLNSEKYCIIFRATFINIRAKGCHTYESHSKCINISNNAIIDNGRVRRATSMTVMLTELDYFIYLFFYEWDDMLISHMWTSIKGRLPKYVLKPLAEAYKNKAIMKHNGKKDTSDYALYKELVNSSYGMMVTRLNTGEVKLSQLNYMWYIDHSNFNYEEEKKKAFLLPQWGIYCTAFSRYRILSAIYSIGDDAIYSDTDSIKYLNNHDDFFNIVNKNANKKVKECCKRLNLPYEYFYDLGCFESEYDGRKVKGKFLGAKRYIIKDLDKTIVTIAGLPKKSLNDYVQKLNLQKEIFEYGNYVSEFDVFENMMLINMNVSLKNAHQYNDIPHTQVINGVMCSELSSVGIFPIDFTMKLSDYYLASILAEREKEKAYEDRLY